LYDTARKGLRKVLAARFHGQRDIRIEEVDAPSATLGPDDVLVKPLLCGICGTDLHEYIAGPIISGHDPHPLTGAQLPQILGHEFAAEVEATGSDVTTVEPGDRVSIMPLVYCGECYYCRRGMNQMCPQMACVGLSTPWGGFASQAIVGQHQVTRLPDGLTLEQGALIEPAAAAVTTVQRGRVQPGDSVLVAGAGPIGALAVLAARAAGAGAVFVSEPNAKRAKRVADLAVTAVFDPTKVDVAAEVRAQTGGQGVDSALECAGNANALRSCLAATRTRGTIALCGLHVEDAAINPMELASRELDLVGVWAYSVHDWARVAAQIDSGAFPVEKVVTSTIPLSQLVEDGFDVLLDPAGDGVKILVEPV
jgi:(R,R)-butanediol dehydrogenase/meso-butanediol dehydrogenase/diacetyl reductase